MKNQEFHQLFVNELEDMYSTEKQIIESLPNLINLASLPDLREALTHHLNETHNQVKRIKKIFSILGITPSESTKCPGIEGLIQEAEKLTQRLNKTATLDAAIIAAAQKIEHYEIASYGTLRSFAKNLGCDHEIINLIQETLDEEASADKKLTKLADGTFFSSGINKEAATSTR